MLQQNSHLIVPERFQECFAGISPLILGEWKQVSAEQLAATNGDLSQVVECIATTTEHTQALVLRQLCELYQIAIHEQSSSESPPIPQAVSRLIQDQISDDTVKQAIAQLEAKTEELLKQFKKEILPEVNQKMQKNPLGTLLTAVGIGFVLGLLLGGRRGR
jgi:ElaB/YqjD/DUF883 family membrane-anchored ribosome-binding protein